jgi:hypothetical protein
MSASEQILLAFVRLKMVMRSCKNQCISSVFPDGQLVKPLTECQVRPQP